MKCEWRRRRIVIRSDCSNTKAFLRITLPHSTWTSFDVNCVFPHRPQPHFASAINFTQFGLRRKMLRKREKTIVSLTWTGCLNRSSLVSKWCLPCSPMFDRSMANVHSHSYHFTDSKLSIDSVSVWAKYCWFWLFTDVARAGLIHFYFIPKSIVCLAGLWDYILRILEFNRFVFVWQNSAFGRIGTMPVFVWYRIGRVHGKS